MFLFLSVFIRVFCKAEPVVPYRFDWLRSQTASSQPQTFPPIIDRSQEFISRGRGVQVNNEIPAGKSLHLVRKDFSDRRAAENGQHDPDMRRQSGGYGIYADGYGLF